MQNNIISDKSADEISKNKTNRIKRIAIILTTAIITVVVVIFVINRLNLSSIYKKGEELIASNEYEQAIEQLSLIKEKNFKDTESLIALCEAYKFYESGFIASAYDRIDKITIRYDSDCISKQSVREFKNRVQEEYKVYKHQMEIKKEQERENRITSGIPYVGMSESRIADTSLGAPSDNVRHNIEIKKERRYTANIYDFYKNGTRIFTARCVNGVVTEVWDDRYTTTSSYKPNSRKYSKKSSPDANKFSNAEDFYDYYYDDFFDYYDAENYYKEHKNK